MRMRLLIILVLTLPLSAQAIESRNLVEQSSFGLQEVAKAGFYGGSRSGTYYLPSAIELGDWIFLLTQGGQFDSMTSPVEYCQGDHTILWRVPRTEAGITGDFLPPIRRFSPCDSSGPLIHWGHGNIFGSGGTLRMLAEAQNPASGAAIPWETWVWEGSFTGDDLVGSWSKILEKGPNGPGRLLQIQLKDDPQRTDPGDGFSHSFARGFARIPSYTTVEIRVDFSDAHCTSLQGSGTCALVEFKSGGVWTAATGGVLNFIPDTLLNGFRPDNIVARAGIVELWGTEITTNSSPSGDCPGTLRSQHKFYEFNPNTFVLGNSGKVFSQFRPSPAQHQVWRFGSDLLRIADKQYLFSTRNEDDLDPPDCTILMAPFQGLDTVLVMVEPEGLIFENGFETGDFSQWTTVISDQ